MLRAGIEECGGGGLGVWGAYIPWVAALLMLFFLYFVPHGLSWPFISYTTTYTHFPYIPQP